MDNLIKDKSFSQRYIYGSNWKTPLWVFLVGAMLNILVPSLVSIPMIFIALAITLVVQRFNKKKVTSDKKI